MEILPASTGSIKRALEVLRNGGIVAHATETCYGLACDLTNPEAVEKLFTIKERPRDQPVSALFASVDEAKRYVEWTPKADALAQKHLPGPLTLILRGKQITNGACPESERRELRITGTSAIRNSQFAIGIRISSHPIASALVKRFGSPLSTTSANLHGQPNPYSAEDIARQFSDQKFQPDLILDSGPLPPTPPSTVIDLTGSGGEIRRKGAVKPDRA